MSVQPGSAPPSYATRPEPRTVGIVMNGVTGRMGRNQHLIRSIMAIREGGGIPIPDGRIIWPEPVLVGRDRDRMAALAAEVGVESFTTDLKAALSDPSCEIYFDAQLTSAREPCVRQAIAAGRHVYCEKPLTTDVGSALELARLADAAGVRQGVVMDKLFLPGLRKLRALIDSGFFGRILAARGEFGYWVFPGPQPPPQRPSWNYRAQDGGGIISDMFCHWQYTLEHLLGAPRSVCTTATIHLPRRTDEMGAPYETTAEDAAYALFELDGGVPVSMNSSWCVRVNRDELFELQVDGTAGSAVAGLRDCRIQPGELTPRSVWNPDLPDPVSHRQAWTPAPEAGPYDNGFKVQWEAFLRHVVLDEPFPWDFRAGARGLQLADAGMTSWRERRWVDVPPLPA
ncbi:MAG: Gfo/Idh/MocA family oxidoreductase [Solirubrobacteraceae bacterium]